jgi:DNA-binding MarR family transcriptional regulator
METTPQNPLALDQQFCFSAYALSRAIMQAYEPLLATLDLTYPQYLAMLVLWQEDGITLKELGARLRLDSGTLTPLLKRLVGKGLVHRERSAADERALTITLTPSGKRLRQKALKLPEAMRCKLAQPLGRLQKLRDELRELLEVLENEANT